MSSVDGGGSVATSNPEERSEYAVQEEPKVILNIIDLSYQASVWQVFLLGMANIVSGLTMNWNRGFSCGFWGFALATFIVALGYISLIVSMAELSSIMVFSGGSYGYVRCSISPFFGFIIGICEWLQNNFYVICCVWSIGKAMTIGTGLHKNLEPVWFLISYLIVLMFHVRGGRSFWHPMCAIAVFTIVTIVLYCLAMMTADPSEFYSKSLSTTGVPDFIGGPDKFFDVLHLPVWFFIGIETILMSGAKIANGTSVIPKALISVLSAELLLTVWILFTTVAIFAGDWDYWQTTDFPLSYGFHKTLGMSYEGATLMTVVPNLAGAVGFLYASKHLTQAMSLSGLLPPYFQQVAGPNSVPIRALFTSALVQYVILVVGWSVLEDPPFFAICLLGACVAYIGILLSYLAFHFKYGQMPRLFVSVFGVPGAILGIIIFIFVFISIVLHTLERSGFLIFLLVLASSTAYYYYVAENRQGFSVEEQKRFMKAYIVNSNARRKHTPFQRFMADVRATCRLELDCFSVQSKYRNNGGGSSPTNRGHHVGQQFHSSKNTNSSNSAQRSSSIDENSEVRDSLSVNLCPNADATHVIPATTRLVADKSLENTAGTDEITISSRVTLLITASRADGSNERRENYKSERMNSLSRKKPSFARQGASSRVLPMDDSSALVSCESGDIEVGPSYLSSGTRRTDEMFSAQEQPAAEIVSSTSSDPLSNPPSSAPSISMEESAVETMPCEV